MIIERAYAQLSDGTKVTLSRENGQVVVILDTPAEKNVPLQFTALGNIPYDSAVHETQWEIGDTHIACALVSKVDGHIIRREPHILMTKGLDVGAQAEKLN